MNGEVESGEPDDHRSQVRGGWESSGPDSLSRGSPENPNWHTPTQRNLDGWVQGTENYEQMGLRGEVAEGNVRDNLNLTMRDYLNVKVVLQIKMIFLGVTYHLVRSSLSMRR